MGIFDLKKRVAIRKRPHCDECYAAVIEARASVKWSDDLQDWQISEITDCGNCAGCGASDAKIIWLDY